MAEITWIKLRTNMFDDEKIKLLERLPDGDMIIVVWIKLLAQAGKVNCGGYIMIAENIPMTADEMVVLFNRPKEKISFALQALQRFGMIELDENSMVFISNWEKHQNIDGMEKIRLQNAERNRRYRERKKSDSFTLSLDAPKERINDVTVTSRDALEKEKEKEKEKNTTVDAVISELKKSDNIPGFAKITDKRKKAINARLEEYGLDKVLETINKIQGSIFFSDAKRDKKNWYTLDWIFNPNNFVKIFEGKYDNQHSDQNTTNSQQMGQQYSVVSNDLYGDV